MPQRGPAATHAPFVHVALTPQQPLGTRHSTPSFAQEPPTAKGAKSSQLTGPPPLEDDDATNDEAVETDEDTAVEPTVIGSMVPVVCVVTDVEPCAVLACELDVAPPLPAPSTITFPPQPASATTRHPVRRPPSAEEDERESISASNVATARLCACRRST
jgi:hypothetical protein